MITKIETFKENFNFNIEKVKPEGKSQLIDLIYETIKKYGNECDLNFIDTSLIENMSHLFSYTTFNGDISDWNVSNVIDMRYMFKESKFNGDISKWDVSNVTNMHYMFEDSKFDGDIKNWKINPNCEMEDMFKFSELKKQNKIPIWYKQLW